VHIKDANSTAYAVRLAGQHSVAEMSIDPDPNFDLFFSDRTGADWDLVPDRSRIVMSRGTVS